MGAPMRRRRSYRRHRTSVLLKSCTRIDSIVTQFLCVGLGSVPRCLRVSPNPDYWIGHRIKMDKIEFRRPLREFCFSLPNRQEYVDLLHDAGYENGGGESRDSGDARFLNVYPFRMHYWASDELLGQLLVARKTDGPSYRLVTV